MKEVKFFQEREIKDHDFLDIIEALKYETYHHEHVIFQWGDFGDKFYILIQGQVRVLIPSPKIKNSKEIMADLVMELNQLQVDLEELDSLISVKEFIQQEQEAAEREA